MDVQDLGVELAAGGLLWRDANSRDEIAIVHRERYDDWSLPKGKLDPTKDENWVQTAVREVTEETGCDVDLRAFAGCISYLVNGTPKVVLFWNMELVEEAQFEAEGETDVLQWVSVPVALEMIDYPNQRALVARATDRTLATNCGGGTLRTHWWRKLRSWSFWPRGASHERLSRELTAYQTELTHLIARVERRQRQRTTQTWPETAWLLVEKARTVLNEAGREQGQRRAQTLPWAEAACSLVEEARVALNENDPDRGWRCLLAARRLELFGLNELGRPALLTKARSIAREADDKLESWRKTAVEDQLGERGELKDDITVAEVYEASAILHGHFNNQYHKIGLLTRRSWTLAIIALVMTAAVLIVHAFLGPLFGSGVTMTGPGFVVSVALFGMLGASVSGFLSLAKAGTKEKIPDLIVSSWATYARPMIGAAAALVLFAFLLSELFWIDDPSPGLAVVVSFAAGSSERLLDRAVRTVEGR